MESNLHYLTFDEVGITIAVIGIALAFVVLVWNAVKAIHDWLTLARRPTAETCARLLLPQPTRRCAWPRWATT